MASRNPIAVSCMGWHDSFMGDDPIPALLTVGGLLGLLLAPFTLIYSGLKVRDDAVARRWVMLTLGVVSIIQSVCATIYFAVLPHEMSNSGV